MAKSARKVGRARTRSGDIGAQGPRTTAEARTIRSVGESQIPSDALELTDKDLSVIRVGNRVLRGRPSKVGNRKLDILPDMPDVRDRIYTPNLRASGTCHISANCILHIWIKARTSSCTGFSLAHVIDFLRYREVGPDSPQRVSSRMLYEMAKRNDEWAGSAYEGSSIRGAIKGFFRNGVCTETTAPDNPGVKNGH